jgi:hypothetical protein
MGVAAHVWTVNLHLHLLELILSGERGPDLHEVSGPSASGGPPQAKQARA